MEANHAKENAKGWAESIAEMLAAVNVDYDRLEELRSTDPEDMTDDEKEELAELNQDAGECKNQDDATERITESVLSVEVRSGWNTVGEPLRAEEFNILLSTGGPALRIVGELDDHGQPSRAWMEYQDWGTPWTQYFDVSQEALVSFASYFYFGEG